MVSVIIINYHSQNYILHCIRTMLIHHDMNTIEVIVVNNAGELDQVKNEFHFVKIIPSDKNLGFSAANNKGLLHAKGDYILYLNPDTYFITEAIHSCVKILKNDLSIGLLGCRLLNEDRTLQLSYHDGNLFLRKLLNRNPFVIKFFQGNKKAKRNIERIRIRHSSDHNADWLTGAFIMMRKKVILDNELLWDEDFFMYWEDVELCHRAKSKGYKCFYTTVAELVHIGGSGENPSASRFEMMEQSKLLYITKTNGILMKKIYFSLMKLELRLERFFERKNSSFGLHLQNEMKFYGVRKNS